MRNVKEKVVNTLKACRENCVLEGELGFSYSKEVMVMFREGLEYREFASVR